MADNEIHQSKSYVSESEQEILKKSRDDKYNVSAVMPLGELAKSETTGTAYRTPVSKELLALRMDDSTTTDVIYLAHAKAGTATSAALWRIKKIDLTSGVVVSWSDGNTYFDNVYDNRASLSYS